MNLNKELKELFKYFKKNKKIFLIAAIALLLVLIFSEYFILILFIVLAAVSKIYHRLFKSSLGIDLVLFTTIITCFRYNIVFGFLVAYIGLVAADIIGSRISYTSLVSLIGLSAVVLLSPFVGGVIGYIILTITYELIAGILYYLMGSSFSRIAVFAASHLVWNIILISFIGI